MPSGDGVLPDLIWRPQAREELFEIYVAIGLDSRSAASRFVERIERRADQLSRHPRVGRRRPHLGDGFRGLVEPPYLVLFRTSPDTDDGPIDFVEIISIVDGRRDLGPLYRQGGRGR